MHHRFRQMVAVMPMGLALAVLAMVIFWPAWRAELQELGYSCGEEFHIDEYGFCVGDGADTPPSGDYLKEGQIWVYRGNGLWVAEWAVPTYEGETDPSTGGSAGADGGTAGGSAEADGGTATEDPEPEEEIGPPLWITTALDELHFGVAECNGSDDNPRIIKYFDATSYNAEHDETPWCSAFVNWAMQEAGIEGTNSARAVSWENWGEFLQDPAIGAVGVINNGDGTGHVGFVVGQDESGKVILLGGNQDNTVEYKAYPLGDFSSFRYPRGYFPTPQDFTLPTMNVAQMNICQ